VFLHIVKALHAGPLWRDEAGALGVASLPSLKQVFTQFPHEAFPMLFPVTVRAVSHLGGNSDMGFRIFGLFVGLGILSAVWMSMWQMRRGVPLLSLALLGLNGALLEWGDSLRGYGMGSAFIVLFAGLLWRVLDKPNRWNVLWAMLAALAAVHCLLHNAPLVLAICMAGTAVAIRRQSLEQSLLVLFIGFPAAVSLLPYLGPLAAARHWDEVVRTSTPPGNLWVALGSTLGPAGSSSAWIWAAVFLGAIVMCLCSKRVTGLADDSRELLLFCLVAVLLSLVACLEFLAVLKYVPRAWYYLALIALTGVLVDGVFNQFQWRWARIGRLFIVLAVVLISTGPAWRAVRTRQSNIDLVADKLNGGAVSGDLIIVRPWALGISFERYYTNSAPWMTVPAIRFHKYHRYDLIQDEMGHRDSAVVLQPIYTQVRRTLTAGRTVWFVGELSWSAAPHEVETPASTKSQEWARAMGSFLRDSASHLEAVPVSCSHPVNEFEDVPLWKLDGWSGN
jgi:hypothetical protein